MNGQPLATVEAALKGENPFAFRVLKEQVDPDVPVASVRVNDIYERTASQLAELEPSFMAYQAVTGLPFIAAHFGMDKSFPSLDAKEQAPFLRVERYIRSQIENGKYTDSAEAARAMVKKLEAKLYLNEHHDPYYKADRMAKYLDAATDHARQGTLKPRLVKEQAPRTLTKATPPTAPKQESVRRREEVVRLRNEREAMRLRIETERARMQAKSLAEEARRLQRTRALVSKLIGAL